MRTSPSRFWGLPGTGLARRSVWLGSAFVVMFVLNIFINLYLVRPADEPGFMGFYWAFVIFMLVCGLAGGILGLIAVTRQHEHSSLIWISVLLGLFVLLLVLNEIMQGIQYYAGA
jgi:quinol-cytochrome oxidoreductase complex cytochrome b subunit